MLECVKYLLPLFGDRKFEVDEFGMTCLHYAVGFGSLSVMRYIPRGSAWISPRLEKCGELGSGT